MFSIGIDLGTTASVVAYIDEQGEPRIIEMDGGKTSVPSVVSYTDDGQVLVGRAAECQVHDGATLFSMKRLIGSNEKKNGKTAVEVSAEILGYMKRRAEEQLGGNIEHAVITVPAHFSDHQRTATKQAASIAGIKVLRLINEPTAAALAFGLDRQENGVLAVYDFGGGTFDFSVLRLSDGVFQVLATGGDNHLGGDDLDFEIAKLNLSRLRIYYDYLSESDQLSVVRIAKSLKEQLCNSDSAEQDCIVNGKQVKFSITRAEAKRLSFPLVSESFAIADQVLRDAGVNELDGIVLAGGMTKLQSVKEAVKARFKCNVFDNVDPETVVAKGAALQADAILKKNKNMLLIDVVPLSLGIETIGGGVDRVIHRNTPIPIVGKREYSTYADYQTGMKFHVVQGERALARDCRSLAEFELKGIPPMPAGQVRIELNFSVDVNGLLHLTAIGKSIGLVHEITVEPMAGVSDDEIMHMLQSAYENKAEDAEQARNLTIKIECERMLKFWHSVKQYLPEADFKNADSYLQLLEQSLQKEDYKEAVTHKQALDKVFGPHLDSIVSAHLSGVSIMKVNGRGE